MTEEPSLIRPEFLVNSDGQTVAQAINAHLEHLLWKYAQPFELAISTAYRGGRVRLDS